VTDHFRASTQAYFRRILCFILPASGPTGI